MGTQKLENLAYLRGGALSMVTVRAPASGILFAPPPSAILSTDVLAMRLETPFLLSSCSSHGAKVAPHNWALASRFASNLGQQKPLSVSTRIRKSKPSILFVTARGRGGAQEAKKNTLVPAPRLPG